MFNVEPALSGQQFAHDKGSARMHERVGSAVAIRRDERCVENRVGAQLGQEEIGNSLSLLAAIGMRPADNLWRWFWRDWRNHRTKAHRAYLYEIIYPQRVELKGAGGRIYNGGPLRDTIAQEKEAAFYVDYDAAKQNFVAPLGGVKAEEAWSRLGTLGYLGLTASAVHDALFEDDAKVRLIAFSEIAFRLCTEELYQEDMQGILSEFESRSERHGVLVASLQTHLDSIRLKSVGKDGRP